MEVHLSFIVMCHIEKVRSATDASLGSRGGSRGANKGQCPLNSESRPPLWPPVRESASIIQ